MDCFLHKHKNYVINNAMKFNNFNNILIIYNLFYVCISSEAFSRYKIRYFKLLKFKHFQDFGNLWYREL